MECRPARVVAVEHVGEFRLRVTFDDDLVRELDLAEVVAGWGSPDLENEAYFARVSVDPVAGTVCWPNGVDLDPDVLHGDFDAASGRSPVVTGEYRIPSTNIS